MYPNGITAQWFFYPAVYFILVVAFTYFYTSIIFNTKEIADNLQKQGGFIEGVRPGNQTAEYLGKTINRLNLFGALALGLIAMLPFLTDYIFIVLSGRGHSVSLSQVLVFSSSSPLHSKTPASAQFPSLNGDI